MYDLYKSLIFNHEWTRMNTNSLAAGPTIPEGFNDKNKTLIMNDANGSGGSAVVIASRGAKDVMRKLIAMEKIFAKNKKMKDSNYR